MNRQDIYNQVVKCACEVFKVIPEHISLNSSIDNVEGWDSLGHLKFIIALEDEFNISFLTEEIPNLRTIDIICEVIGEYLS